MQMVWQAVTMARRPDRPSDQMRQLLPQLLPAPGTASFRSSGRSHRRGADRAVIRPRWFCDVLRYVYDYGDEWRQVLKLEKLRPEPCDRPAVLAGKYEAPEEDHGGIDGSDREPLDLVDLNEVLADWATDRGIAMPRVSSVW